MAWSGVDTQFSEQARRITAVRVAQFSRTGGWYSAEPSLASSSASSLPWRHVFEGCLQHQQQFRRGLQEIGPWRVHRRTYPFPNVCADASLDHPQAFAVIQQQSTAVKALHEWFEEQLLAPLNDGRPTRFAFHFKIYWSCSGTSASGTMWEARRP